MVIRVEKVLIMKKTKNLMISYPLIHRLIIILLFYFSIKEREEYNNMVDII